MVVSSRDVAESFGKYHKDVLKSIREILKEENYAIDFFPAADFFDLTTYKVPNCNKTFPEYLMDRDGFTLLAMGFTGEDAIEFVEKYVDTFTTKSI